MSDSVDVVTHRCAQFVANFLAQEGLDKLAKQVIKQFGIQKDNTVDLKALILTDLKKLNKGKRNKDPNRPKRPRTAYLYFCDEHRDQVRADHPDWSMTQVMTGLSQLWRKVSSKDRKRFEAMSVKAKADYVEAMKSYERPLPVPDVGKSGLVRKRVKDPNRPKRPLSAYLAFGKDERPKVQQAHPEMNSMEVMQEVAKRWKKLQESGSSRMRKYEEISRKAKEAYNEEMANYEPPPVSFVVVDVSSKSGRQKHDPLKPTRPANAYIRYVQQNRAAAKKKYPKMSATEIMQYFSKKWHKLSDDRKKPFNDAFAKDQAVYKKAMEEYLRTNPAPAAGRKRKRSDSTASAASAGKTAKAPKAKRGKKATKVKPFDLYVQKKRAKVERNNPNASEKQVMQILKQKFASISAERRQRYESDAAALNDAPRLIKV